MLKKLIYGGPYMGAAFLPMDFKNHDKLSPDIKTVQDFQKRGQDNETGLQRLKMMFSLDEFGGVTTEVNAIYQAGFFGFLVGAVYGGFINSRNSYENFMNNNQATAFTSHFEAKKKLQNEVTVSFAKGAFRWGWRLSLFTASYVGISTAIAVYRGKSSMIEYMTAGGVTGAMYKVNLGVRGVLVGCGLGTALGCVAGAASLLVLKTSGMTMEEVRYWQYKWKTERDSAVNEAIRMQSKIDEDAIIDKHDEVVGTQNLTLDCLEVKEKKADKL